MKMNAVHGFAMAIPVSYIKAGWVLCLQVNARAKKSRFDRIYDAARKLKTHFNHRSSSFHPQLRGVERQEGEKGFHSPHFPQFQWKFPM